MPGTRDAPPAANFRPAASLRAAAADRNTICAAAAIVTAGVTTGVSALLVPAQLHAAGASPGRIGLYFSIAGMLFVAGGIITRASRPGGLGMAVLWGGGASPSAGPAADGADSAPSHAVPIT